MTVYLVDPDRYGGGKRAETLFGLVQIELSEFVDVTRLDSENAVWAASPGSADALVLANPVTKELPEELVELVEKSQRNGAVTIPVAGEIDRRTPPDGLDKSQSFDVTDRLRLRAQPDTALPVVAADLARSILSRVSPTLMKDQLRLFLCHRRVDGEEITAALDRALSARHEEHVFRDLISIQVGEVAQHRIEESLEEADVVIFLDTPLAGESDWVARELQLALGRQVPIVWVRLGSQDARATLLVQPAGRPHLSYDHEPPEGADADDLADKIISIANELASENVRTAHRTFSRVSRMARSKGKTVEALDQRRLIYSVTDLDDNQGEDYPRRPHNDIVQVFGRHPMPHDRAGLVKWLNQNGYGPHDRACRAFDAAILLDPLSRYLTVDAETSVVVTHGADYLARLNPDPERTPVERRLLLLGAFPEEAGAQEPVKQAVYAVALWWLAHGGQISFGGHPTFTPMITEIAHRLGVDLPRTLTIYQSEQYVPKSCADDLRTQASVDLVPAGKDRDESLTLMRTRMIEAETYDIVAAIGGRTSEGGAHKPGIDEEIALAEATGVRPILFGAPGGRAAQLAAEAERAGWPRAHNKFTTDQHRWFATTDDYVAAVQLLWENGGD